MKSEECLKKVMDQSFKGGNDGNRGRCRPRTGMIDGFVNGCTQKSTRVQKMEEMEGLKAEDLTLNTELIIQYNTI